MDHLVQLPDTGLGGPEEPMLESYSTLGFLAGVTSRIRLGALVGCAVFRSPGLLVKTATTVDVLSGGRLTFGIGAGWYREEALGLGIPWPERRERFARLEDALKLLPLMWGPGSPRFEGRTITVPEATCYPRPLQERVPILVGGSGERRTLRLVARHADACNLLGDRERSAASSRCWT